MALKKFSIDPSWPIILKELDINQAELLKSAHLPGDLFKRKEQFLFPEEYFRLWDALERFQEDPAFPLKLASFASLDIFDPAVFAAACSPNLNVGFSRISSYKPLCGPIRLDLKITTKTTKLAFHFEVGDLKFPTSLVATELVFFVWLVRKTTREKIIPLEVNSPLELPRSKKYASYFGVKPTLTKELSLVFSGKDARCPFLTENEQMWKTFQPDLKKRLIDLDSESSFTSRVHSSLLELLPSGRSNVNDVAQKLAISKRTLQRKLLGEKTNYQSVLSDVRENLANHYLTKTNMTAAQISFLLGFDEPNSFFRAFRSWTGTTPERIRLKKKIP